jgi:hypothetical protein
MAGTDKSHPALEDKSASPRGRPDGKLMHGQMASPNGEAKNRNSRKHFPQGKIRQEKGRKGDRTIPFFFLIDPVTPAKKTP